MRVSQRGPNLFPTTQPWAGIVSPGCCGCGAAGVRGNLAALSPVVDERAARDVRTAFLAAGWVPGAVTERVSAEVGAALERGEPAPVLEVFDASDRCASPFGIITRMFGLRLPVRTDVVAAALPLEAATSLGLIEQAGEYCRPLLQVTPFNRAGWWVVSDWSGAVRRGPLPDNSVLGYSGASHTLATITPRGECVRAADIGTGSGVQALLLTDHADHVVATDVDDRALSLALRTFTLSDVDVDLRKGSLFEPLHGQQFDLIVSNPPFVIGRHGSVFRDAGFADDGLGAAFLRDVAAHLTPGGIAVVLLNWISRNGIDWREHVTSWLDEAPLDAWIAQRQALDPSAYASAWLADLGIDPRGAAADHRNWLRALAAAEADGVGMGWAAVRRTAGERVVVAEDVSAAVRLPNGDEVVEALDLLPASQLNAFAVLQARLRPASGARLFRATALGGSSGATPPLVGVADHWRGDVVVDDLVAFVLEHSDGHRTFDELVEAAADEFELDYDEVLGGALASVKGLLATGVVRAESSDIDAS